MASSGSGFIATWRHFREARPRPARETTLEAERREVLEAVLDEQRRQDPGRNRAAAWAFLLRHLSAK